jgi:hypothetical protein
MDNPELGRPVLAGTENGPGSFSMGGPGMTTWSDIAPHDARGLDLREHPELLPPLNEAGEPCPWSWGPQQLAGAPLGQHHCEYCGAMCMAGMPHPDCRDQFEEDLLEHRYGLFTGTEITGRPWPGTPRFPGITVVLTGTPRSAGLIIAAVVRALAIAGHDASTFTFLTDVTASGRTLDSSWPRPPCG